MVVSGMYLAGRYEIQEKIGSGGMADVYKAKDHKLNRLVAIKVLKSDFSNDETFVKKFRVEAQSAAGLSHPNIVNVYDVGEEHGVHFIVMELIQGISLKKYIEMKGKLDIKEALNISVQIASGLSAAHDNRIVHRDIKPQNIIMSRDGKVKVTDFGIAKVADSTTVTTNAAGSVHYISPEQARGGYSDGKSDIYSLGITMYEMLTGKLPFEGETNVAVALLHIQGEMVPPRQLEPSIPRSFEKIILKCTQKKVERRYATARDLIADLRKVLTHPDGAYVSLGGMAAIASEATVVLGEDDINRVRAGMVAGAAGVASTGNGAVNAGGTGVTTNVVKRTTSQPVKQTGSAPRTPSNAKPTENTGKTNTGRKYIPSDDDDNDNVNPALEKVMIVLGIIGALILVVVIFFVIGKAVGLFNGNNNKETPAIETEIDKVETESDTEETESDTENVEMVEVPKLIDLTESQAQIEAGEAGFFISVKTEENNDVEDGVIFEQDPKPGEELEKGETIYVTVAKAGMVTIDDIVGMSLSQATKALENQGLKVSATTDYQFSDVIDEDKAIGTNPEVGTSVKKGQVVVIILSKGPEFKDVKMPKVVGSTEADAKAAIESAGLKVGEVTSEHSDSVAAGNVISASVAEGTEVKEGTAINLVISKGPQKKTYIAFLSIQDSPIGGLEGDQTAYVAITVYKPDGTSEVILSGEFQPGTWVPVEENITSTRGGQGSYEITVDGVSFGISTINFEEVVG